MKNTYNGFTLIEILIALTIFAILASITSSSLYYAFTIRSRVTEQANKINTLQFVVSLLQQDTSQIVERSIRGTQMHLFPVFVGQPQYVEFSRDGNLNPEAIEKRSSLKRIALLCKDDSLLRRTWSSLDPVERNQYSDQILFRNITECRFNYLNRSLQLLNEWREQAVSQNQVREPLPKAIQLNIVFQDWGKMNLLFIIPEALYVQS